MNIAEIDLSCLTCQCVSGREIGSEQELREQSQAWADDLNATQRGADWPMKIDNARMKPESVSPHIELFQTTSDTMSNHAKATPTAKFAARQLSGRMLATRRHRLPLVGAMVYFASIGVMLHAQVAELADAPG